MYAVISMVVASAALIQGALALPQATDAPTTTCSSYTTITSTASVHYICEKQECPIITKCSSGQTPLKPTSTETITSACTVELVPGYFCQCPSCFTTDAASATASA